MAHPGAEPQEKAEEEHSGGFRAREVLETVILTALIFLAVHFSIQPYRVDGPSMRPGLHTDELLVVNLLTYHFGSPRRGDVVVLHPPGDDNSQYVKRIIGLPGDTIVLTPDSVSVDGTSLHEPYTQATAPNQGMNVGGCLDFSATSQIRIVLQRDQYYVMGDNRRDSLDSRCFGPVTGERLIGKAEVVIFPLDSLHWLSDYSNVFSGAKP